MNLYASFIDLYLNVTVSIQKSFHFNLDVFLFNFRSPESLR